MSEESNQQVATGFSGKLAKPPWGYRKWMLTGNPAIFFDHLANRFGDFVHYRGAFNFYLINHIKARKANAFPIEGRLPIMREK